MERVLICGGLAESLIHFRGHLLQTLQRDGHEVHACAPDIPYHVYSSLTSWGITPHTINLARNRTNPISDLKSYGELLSLMRRIKPSVYLGYTIKPVIYGSLAARRAGTARIFSLITGLGYAFSTQRLKQRLVGIAARRLYKAAMHVNDKVFFQNSDDIAFFTQHRFLREPGHAVLVPGSGIDVDAYTPEPYPKNISFLLIARLLVEKGIREYVAAARNIREKYPGTRLRLVGWLDEGPNAISKRELDRWIAAGDIEYLGYLSDVRPAIADCSVYVLPSYYREGLPRTLLEAMSMRRPVITTDSPGCREPVRVGESGFLVPPRDVHALVEAMETFIRKPELVHTMGEVGRHMALETYDVRKVNAQILDAMRLNVETGENDLTLDCRVRATSPAKNNISF